MSDSERPVVIDASIALCVLLGEPDQHLVARALQGWATTSRPMFVPPTFWLEVVNRLSREPDLSGKDVLASLHRLYTFDLQTFDGGRAMLLAVIDNIERHRLTAYDATYLVLAELLDADLATFDRLLAAAAGPRAISVEDGHRLHETPAVYEHDVTWPRYKEASAYLAKLRAEALAGRTG